MRRFVPFHQIEATEKQIGRLLRATGLSNDRQEMSNRLIGLGDYASAETVKEAAPLVSISDLPAFRENFSILFDRLPTLSVFDAILADAVPAPIRGQIFSGTPLALFEISEGQPIPFAMGNLTDEGELLPLKVAGLLGYSQEFLRNLEPEVDDGLNRAFLNAIARATDRALINRLSENTGPAILATSSFSADIKAGAELILNGKSGRLHLILSPQTAIEMGFAANPDGTFLFSGFDINTGGVVGGLRIHVSDQLQQDSSGSVAILFDASRIAANKGSIDIQRSENASVQMRSDPENGPTQVVSSFQTNSVFLRVLRTFGLKVPDNETIAVEFSGVVNWFGED